MDKNDKLTTERIIKHLKKINSSTMIYSDSNHYINPMNTYVYYKTKHYNLPNEYKEYKQYILYTQIGLVSGTLLFKLLSKRKFSLNYLYPFYAIVGLQLLDNYFSYCFLKSNINSLYSLVKRDNLYQSIKLYNDITNIESIISSLYSTSTPEASNLDLKNKFTFNKEIFDFASDLLYAPRDEKFENDLYFTSCDSLLEIETNEKYQYFGIKHISKQVITDQNKSK